MWPFVLPTIFPPYSDTSSESSSQSESQNDEDDQAQPPYYWDGNKRASVNDYGSTIFWLDGSCKGNHLGPRGGATSGVGVWVHGRKNWRKFNHIYPHTNNVSYCT